MGKGLKQQTEEGDKPPEIRDKYLSTLIYYGDTGGTVLNLHHTMNLRTGAEAAIELAEVVERVRVKYLKRVEAEAKRSAEAALRPLARREYLRPTGGSRHRARRVGQAAQRALRRRKRATRDFGFPKLGAGRLASGRRARPRARAGRRGAARRACSRRRLEVRARVCRTSRLAARGDQVTSQPRVLALGISARR